MCLVQTREAGGPISAQLTRAFGRLLFRVSPKHRRHDEVQHNHAMIEDLVRERRQTRRARRGLP